ncbi:MAG TPA: DUF4062 domain-containing protein [Allosphingosinicella sp.]
MSTKLRIFISSTMQDLGNERRAVVERLQALNLEPVNAEGLLPRGRTSWEVISEEIESSHIFVLLLGETYGWIPDSGYGAGLGKSVTHLEHDHARLCGLPVLPFQKKLKYGAESDSDDARARDSFRQKVSEWSQGLFRGEFEWADELGRQVGDALLDLFQNSALKNLARKRDLVRRPAPAPAVELPLVRIPLLFHGACLSGPAILVAGAGISVSAGLPMATVLAEVLARRLSLEATGDQVLARHRFADLAALAINRLGRDVVLELIGELLNTAQEITPTVGHTAAVLTFETIVTSNFDTLFEQAAVRQGLRAAVRTSSQECRGEDVDLTICKIDGTIADPGTLVLTDEDSARAYQEGGLWTDVADLLQRHPVAVVGHSLRDDRMRRLLSQRRRDVPGVYVSPVPDPLDAILLERFGLEMVRATADEFLASLASSLAASRSAAR